MEKQYKINMPNDNECLHFFVNNLGSQGFYDRDLNFHENKTFCKYCLITISLEELKNGLDEDLIKWNQVNFYLLEKIGFVKNGYEFYFNKLKEIIDLTDHNLTNDEIKKRIDKLIYEG